MRLISFRTGEGRPSFGRLDGDQVVDLGSAEGGSLKQALASGFDFHAAGPSLPLADVTLLPVIPDPAKIFCIGLNYASHAAEMGHAPQTYPTVFTRWPDTLVADGGALQKPRSSESLDYEGELAVIIGKGGRGISRAEAADHIAGYSIFNDASVRDWQRHTSQFTPGKNFPLTAGFGPALVTPDEVGEVSALRVQTTVNGMTMQDQTVSDLIFDIPALIEYLSAFTNLSPGDVIATGTPGGVGDGHRPPAYLRTGDVVEVSIGVLGKLRNAVVEGP